MNKNILFLFFIVILSSFVIGEIPSQNFGDLNIVYPQQEVFSVDKNFSLNVKVYDNNNVLLNVSNYNCSINVYSVSGDVEVSEYMVNSADSYTKTFLFDKNVHNDIGVHSYNIMCDNITSSGIFSSSFLVSKSGLNYNDMFKVVLLYVVCLGLLLSLLSFIAFKIDDKHIILKFFTISFVIFLGVTMTRSLYLFEPSSLNIDLVKYYMRFIKFFVIYIFLAFLWIVADYYNKTLGIKNWFNEKFGRNKGYD